MQIYDKIFEHIGFVSFIIIYSISSYIAINLNNFS